MMNILKSISETNGYGPEEICSIFLCINGKETPKLTKKVQNFCFPVRGDNERCPSKLKLYEITLKS
jgi:hypothetical protein